MSSDEDVDEFGRTRVKNRKRSTSDSPPARYKRPNKRSPRRSRSPARRSRSPRRRSRSPKKSPRRDRSPNHRRSGREQRTSPPIERPLVRDVREESVRRKEGSAPPKKREEVGPTFDSAVDSYVNSLKKIPRVRNINPADEDDDDPVLAAALEDDTNLEDEQMAKLLGFSTFDTTKGKKVDGSCNASATAKIPKRKYRQYMNRRGGFNRPLDPIL